MNEMEIVKTWTSPYTGRLKHLGLINDEYWWQFDSDNFWTRCGERDPQTISV